MHTKDESAGQAQLRAIPAGNHFCLCISRGDCKETRAFPPWSGTAAGLRARPVAGWLWARWGRGTSGPSLPEPRGCLTTGHPPPLRIGDGTRGRSRHAAGSSGGRHGEAQINFMVRVAMNMVADW